MIDRDGADSLRARYLETALAASHIFDTFSAPAAVADFLREKIRLDATHFALYEGDPSGEVVFGSHRETRCLAKHEVASATTGLHELIKERPPAITTSARQALQVLETAAAVLADSDHDNSIVIAPLNGSSRVQTGLGVLLLVRANPGFDASERRLIGNLADTLSLAIERTEYLDDSAVRTFMERARADLANTIHQCRHEGEVIDLTLAYLETLYGVEGGIVLMSTDHGLEMEALRHEGRTLSVHGLRLPPGSGRPLVSFLDDSESGVLVSDMPAGVFSGLEPSDETGRERLTTLLRVYGSLATTTMVTMKIPEVGVVLGGLSRELPQIDVGALDIVLGAASATIRELRRGVLQRREARKLAMAHELARRVRGIPMGQWRDKLQFIAQRLCGLLGSSTVAIMLNSRRSRHTLKTVVVVRSPTLAVPEDQATVAVLRDIAETVHLARQETSLDLLPQDLLSEIETSTLPPFHAVPIRPEVNRDRQIAGVLLVTSTKPFDDGDLAIVRDIANLLASTIKDELHYKRESQLATRDVLTGIHNRRYFLRRATDWLDMATRYDRVFAIGLLDIDHFKQINDTYGHDCGDLALRHIAHLIEDCMRDVDILARYGGEEFVIVLPETSLEGARNIAERIRERVQATPFDWRGEDVSMTISGGVAAYGQNQRYLQRGLYRVCCAGHELVLDSPEAKGLRLGVSTRYAMHRGRLVNNLAKVLGTNQDTPEIAQILQMIEAMTSVDGLITIADGRLYRSKDEGRNRVSSGAW